MEFDTDSIIVHAWARMVQLGSRTMAEVPELHNLRAAVAEALEKQADE